MEHPTNIYLFGDQTVDCTQGLTSLLRGPKGPILFKFLDEAYLCLREAIHSLSSSKKSRLAKCSSLEDLVQENYRHPALQQALTCIYHVACFILNCEQNGGLYPHPEQSVLVGICTGAFAAAAIGCCRALPELVPVATHAVKVAFNTGICAHTMGETIERSSMECSASAWSLIVLELSIDDARDVLHKFIAATRLPLTSQPWVSAASHRGVTISAPPGVLGQLKRFPALLGRRLVDASVFAPYHAAQMFDEAAIQSVLEQSQSGILARHKSQMPIMSVSSGGLIRPGDANSILRTAISDSLTKMVRMDKAFDNLLASIETSKKTAVTIFAIATSAGQALSSALTSKLDLKGISVRVETLAGLAQTSDHHMRDESRRPKLAIVGVSGRFPEADNLDEYWRILVEGLDVHKPVPDFHWDVQTHVDVDGKRKNTSATPYGCWLKEPGAFDANFFNMSPREAPQVDPAQRIALMTAYEAMENAGMVPDATPSTRRDRVGVFYGVAANDWMETNSGQNIGEPRCWSTEQTDTYYMPGGNRAFIPGRINYFFKYTGPSYSVDTACSSSLASFHLACNALWAGEVDTAFAGGCNIVTNPDLTAGLDRGHFLSRTGNCKTFDETADGYCRAEGVVTVIVKRLEDAIHDHDPIHAVIRGASTNHSSEADSITRPYVGAQKAVFRKILHIAGVDPVDVDYVEMHGTGTRTGDPGEMQSVLDVFAPPVPSGRRPHQPLHIGSVKPNIGHMEAASGLSSLVKVLLMLKNDVIVPHTGIKTRLNSKFPQDLAARQVFISQTLKQWPRPKHSSRKVFVNNFSAAGGNSGLLLEDPPDPSHGVHKFTDPRLFFPVAISGKSTAALQRNVERLLRYIDTRGLEGEFLPALSYTTTARRIHHPYRAIVSGSSIADVKNALRETLDSDQVTARVRTKPKVIFAFTGQGSQYTGMGQFYSRTFASFRDEVTRIDSLARRLGFSSFLPVLTGETDVEGQSPEVVQLSIVALEIALARLWISWGAEPTCVVGHSLGEYAALCICGVLSIVDTLYLVGKRAQLLEKHCQKGSHAMLAVKESVRTIEIVLGTDTLDVACINGPQDTVLAGNLQDIARAQRTLSEAKVKSVLVKVPFAFHSAQVDPILPEFVHLAQGVRYSKPTLPIMCPLMGSSDCDDAVSFGGAYLRDHCRKPVDMLGSIRAAQRSGKVDGGTLVLEVGPHPVVCGMFAVTVDRSITTLPSLSRAKDTSRLIANALSKLYLAGTVVDWQEYNRGRHYEVLALPNYSWDLQNYWIQYINDWSLYKGEPVHQARTGEDNPETSRQVSSPIRLANTAVHEVVSDDISATGRELVVESDLSRPDLNRVVQGHKVEGHNLCTPSVYAEIAFTAGNHLFHQRHLHADGRDIEVVDFAIKRALLTDATVLQTLRTSVSLRDADGEAFCRSTTLNAASSVDIEHATCIIRLSKKAQVTERVSTIKSRVAALRTELSEGQAFNFNRSMAYRMVSDYVVVEPTFRGMESVLMNNDSMDAYGTVNFAGMIPASGDFHAHPAVLDAFTQLPGFILNANEKADVQHEVFVNQGWQSMRLVGSISTAKKYQTYARMQEKARGIWQGDLTVLDKDDGVVALFNGFTLRTVPRQLLKYVFSSSGEGAGASTDGSPTTRKAELDRTSGEKVGRLSPMRQGGNDDGLVRPSGRAASTGQPPSDEVGCTRAGILHAESPWTSNGASLEQTPSPTISSSPDPTDTVLRIISEESGIATEALTDESRFDDLGVDSFLSLLIVGRLGRETEFALDASTFARVETVKDLKEFVGTRWPSSRTGGSPASSALLQTDSSAAAAAAETARVETPGTEIGEHEAKTLQ